MIGPFDGRHKFGIVSYDGSSQLSQYSENQLIIIRIIMKSTLSKEAQLALNHVLAGSLAGKTVHLINVCHQSEMEQFFRLQREGVCRYFLKNECRKGDACEFRHSEDQIKTKYKTKLCKNFSDKGFCKYKDQCSYAHGEKELKSGGAADNHHGKYPRSSEDEN